MVALVFLAGGVATAQDTTTSDLPRLELSKSQKETIYLSISNQPHLKSAAPATFHIAPGANLPAAVKVEPMPKTIIELMPQTAGYEIAYVANQVLIIEPKSKRVIEVISGGAM
jgi:hypothetical protein